MTFQEKTRLFTWLICSFFFCFWTSALADVPTTSFGVSSSIAVSGNIATICNGGSGTTYFYPMSSVGAYDGGQFGIVSTCSSLDMSQDLATYYGTGLTWTSPFAPVIQANEYNGSSLFSPDIFYCGGSVGYGLSCSAPPAPSAAILCGVSTTTACVEDASVDLGLAILIGLVSLAFVAYIWNAFIPKRKKPWQH